MTTISEALRDKESIYYLLELNLEGRKYRYSTANVTVPYSGHAGKLFKDKLRTEFQLMSNFDFRSFRYSSMQAQVRIINDERLQDLELKTKFDKATAKVWLWCKGLDWSDIEDYPVFYGAVRKNRHSRDWYELNLIDPVSAQYSKVEQTTYSGSPGEVVEGILQGSSNIEGSAIDYGSFKDLDQLCGTLSLSVLVDQRVETFDLVDRIFGQCKAGRNQKNGKICVVPFDLNASPSVFIKDEDLVLELPNISTTPYELVCNDLSISYGPSGGSWGTTITKDRTNNEVCKRSYYSYGAQPQQQLLLPDCDSRGDAEFCINRHLDFFAFRHDVVELPLHFYKAWDLQEGDIAKITLEDGASADGNGWVNEECLLVSKSFLPNFIRTKWWRINTD